MGAVNTWTLLVPDMIPAVTKVMAGIHNGSAARNIRIRRVGIINAQIVLVSNVACLLDVRHYYNAVVWGGGPTAVTPIAHDTGNVALDTVTAGYGGAAVGGLGPNIFRRTCWPTGEALKGITAVREADWCTMVPLGIMFDPGYADANEQPLLLKNGELMFVYNTPNVAFGLMDIWIEFTDEAV